jgi:hypothetical protein
MKKGYTHIAALLDKSGSMGSLRKDVIGGFNTFLSENKKVEGECTLTLVLFDYSPFNTSVREDGYETYCSNANINLVNPLNESTYVPRGATAYLDAIGKLIDDTGEYLNSLSEEEKPEKVIFYIFTDGLENDSVKYSKEEISLKIKHQTEVYNWQFTFLGANMDAVSAAADIQIPMRGALTYNVNNMQEVWGLLSKNVAKYRAGDLEVLCYSDEQRETAIR